MSSNRERLLGIIEAFSVTFLWSSSYILVKIGLNDIRIPPSTLVSYRYAIASMILVPIAVHRKAHTGFRDVKTLSRILFLGFTGYTVAQGLQCLGLFYLPAVTVTFLLNFTPVMVLLLGILTLNERPSPAQIAGLLIILSGVSLFFNKPLSKINLWGMIITLISGLGWASYMVYIRRSLIAERVSNIGLTAFSMGVGTVLLLAVTLLNEGLYPIPIRGWVIIFWLGIVNTSIAFFLWNDALSKLEAFETAIIQNTMLIQIAILSWVFMDEKLSPQNILAITLVFLGVLIVQIRPLRSRL
ncbi:MAG: EamA family transporter [Candidatus Bathyarchaeota archaeon]|jgi:drug/metabolite transporter (DMT)-like permease